MSPYLADDRNPGRPLLRCEPDQREVFLVSQRSRLTGRTAHDETLRAVLSEMAHQCDE